MELLKELARRYETASFINGDPSWFMHQVEGRNNQEALAFIASCLSYGSRKQFFPKIQYVFDCSGGSVYDWVRSGDFRRDIPDTEECYYRLYTCSMMNRFLQAYRELMNEHDSLGEYLREGGVGDAFRAVEMITSYFASKGIEVIVPKDTKSSCKRICMFLRWMVRDNSPVDLGLWTFIDKRTLIMPLDTHVLQEACSMRLLQSKSASMAAAKKLTAEMAAVFPDDPLKGDFALFGYGVDK
ncbi:MAG: TIGR02757 family protein [Prevotella sp.]|uniref:TIGR02757 family protein n=1 Tax=Prevotella sp. TaxID=59823 RepID=UPI002A317C67|nr:TIGR02757 family protein [Prevotella sp.]MDD7317876.1 TIGR02757 family protein [Prevotellaceae bacterium]MDY4019665.1 TIGR02757 family protein [Prevotella sp.]